MPKSYSNIHKELTKPKQVTIKEDEELYNDRPVTKWPVPDRPTTSEILNKNFRTDKTDARASLQHHQTNLQAATDDKMNTFLDEMR